MPPRVKPSAAAERQDGRDPLLDLTRSLLAGPGGEAAPDDDAGTRRSGERGEGTGADAELALSELIADGNGEVVIYNDSGFRTLAIATDAAVVAAGRCEAHVTAAGEDVSGFRFMRFDDGTTLYYREGLDLITSRRRG